MYIKSLLHKVKLEEMLCYPLVSIIFQVNI